MELWLRLLIEASVAGLRAIVTATWERIAWVYALFVRIMLGIRISWDALYNGAKHALRNLISTVSETWITLYWIARILIPQRIGYAVDGIVRILLGEIQRARDFINSGIEALSRWIRARIDDVQGGISTLARWIRETVSSIWDTLRRVADRVFTLLTSPRRMASWLLGALMAELILWVDANLESIFMWIRRRTIHYTLRIADRIEDVMARLL